MSKEQRMYRMTEFQRQQYLTLLFSGRESEALALRDKWDDFWASHPEEWEKCRPADDEPIRL